MSSRTDFWKAGLVLFILVSAFAVQYFATKQLEHKPICFVVFTKDGVQETLQADYAYPIRSGDLVVYRDGEIVRSVAAGHWSDMYTGRCR